jgi:D-alanyl-lipoteichoic acid acyltransferase DltB (MBOAT superfamily)
VAFFPQLMAGPIERAAHMLPQFHHFPKVRLQNFTDGLSLFLVGLFKKLALANYLSLYVERVYDSPRQFEAPRTARRDFAFAWQIFFDFSGYTDMARGIAKVMGFDLMLNFTTPTSRQALANSGAAGTLVSPPGFGTMFIFPRRESRGMANHLIATCS